MTDTMAAAVRDGITDVRLATYLQEVDGDLERALELYDWNGRMAAECFVAIGHLEVLMRNAIDHALRTLAHEDTRRVPWYLQRGVKLESSVRNEIENVRDRLVGLNRSDSRDNLIANLSFGTWTQLLGAKHDELWNRGLRTAFPNAMNRKQVHELAEAIRRTRNKVAHHNYLRTMDVPHAMDQVFQLAELISPEYARWMKSRSSWQETFSACPRIEVDTVVVAANVAWDVYEHCGIYVCRVGRYFRDVERLAFYESQSIRRQFPRIIHRFDGVEWSTAEAERRKGSADLLDQKLGRAMQKALSDEGTDLAQGWGSDVYQVFLLTPSRPRQHGDDGHRVRSTDIPHLRTGRGSAFTQGQRYVSLHRLLGASSTDDVVVSRTDMDGA